jgi:endonuclease/exonuclease/phosphatase family metal-dependent hydrolase
MMLVPSNANCFSVATYNILAKSLGTNTIPWVMTVSPSMQKRIQDATSQPFKEWVDTSLKPEYMAHFHKNFAAGNYATMRSFWGTSKCHSPQDIPEDLTGLTWTDENVISYGDPPIQATTLQGMAQKTLPAEVARDFFREVSASEEQIYAWPVRGPRIFATATRTTEKEPSPDIIALQEYDCHNVVADYRSPGCSETFAEAMTQIGYDGAFFLDPLKGKDPSSGLGVFWKRDVFETVTGITGVVKTLECNTDEYQGAVYNFDLQEHCHSTKEPNSPDPILMNAADRRNAALCRLRHKPSGRAVAICVAHLMTTSRDNAKTNRFPGEVRAGELAVMKALVESHTHPDDGVVVLGDFNTDAKEAHTLFSGQIAEAPSEISDDRMLQIETGFQDGRFLWGPHVLEDAFRDVHQWGPGVGVDKHCTSRNAVRIEWIDYILYNSRELRPKILTACKTPPSMIPNLEHPSDHLPLFATLEFV